MKVELWLRSPGNHRKVWSGKLDALPRTGELVVLPGEESPRSIHEISHKITSKGQTVKILLVDD